MQALPSPFLALQPHPTLALTLALPTPTQVLSRSVIPLSSLDAFRPHETDDVRLDLQLQDGTAFGPSPSPSPSSSPSPLPVALTNDPKSKPNSDPDPSPEQDGTLFAMKLDSNDRRELWMRYLQASHTP